MATKKRKSSKRGLRGTPAEHEARARAHLRIANLPSTYGCQVSLESLGAAKAEASWMKGPFSDDFLESFQKAERGLARCSCKR